MYLITYIKDNLAWFLTEDILNPEHSQQVLLSLSLSLSLPSHSLSSSLSLSSSISLYLSLSLSLSLFPSIPLPFRSPSVPLSSPLSLSLHLSLSQVTRKYDALCAELTPHSLSLVESFKISDEMLSAPIGRDWVKFNEYDNKGELEQFTDWAFKICNYCWRVNKTFKNFCYIIFIKLYIYQCDIIIIIILYIILYHIILYYTIYHDYKYVRL